MRTRASIAVTICLFAVLAFLGGAWHFALQRSSRVCPFSGREIHPQTRALVTIGGKKYETCCVRCAIIEAQQTGMPITIRKVAAFDTGKLIDPERAWFVESSNVNLCMRMAPAVQYRGRGSVYVRTFDRCSPSVLAFLSEQHARAFSALHGGTLKRLADLQAESTMTTGTVQRP